MTRIYVLVFLCGIGTPALPAPAPESSRTCRVVRVEDAATFAVRCGELDGTLRLPGVRAPRPGPPHAGGEPFGDRSRRLAAELLNDESVTVERPHDPSARVRWRHRDLVETLLRLGWLYLRREGDPPLQRHLEAERDARSRRRGVWSAEAWEELRDRWTEPVTLEAPSPPGRSPALGERARDLEREPWSRRKAAFEAALRKMKGDDPNR